MQTWKLETVKTKLTWSWHLWSQQPYEESTMIITVIIVPILQMRNRGKKRWRSWFKAKTQLIKSGRIFRSRQPGTRVCVVNQHTRLLFCVTPRCCRARCHRRLSIWSSCIMSVPDPFYGTSKQNIHFIFIESEYTNIFILFIIFWALSCKYIVKTNSTFPRNILTCLLLTVMMLLQHEEKARQREKGSFPMPPP